MEEYGKVFREISSQKKSYTLCTYRPEEESYFEVVKRARESGKRQVVLNSEIMTELMLSIINNGGIVRKINLSDSTDQEVVDNITSIINKMKSDPLMFVKLKQELEWVYDSGSIDINSVTIYFNSAQFTVYSNGIVFGQNPLVLFETILIKVLEEFFDE